MPQVLRPLGRIRPSGFAWPDGRAIADYAGRMLAVFAVCYLAIQVGHGTKLPNGIAALWPESAILVAILVASPLRYWWGFLPASYATYVADWTHMGFSGPDVVYHVADTVKVLVAAFGIRFFAGGVRTLDTLPGLAHFVLIAGLLAPGLSATVAGFANANHAYAHLWRTWFFAEALTLLTVTPALLAWINALRNPAPRMSRKRLGEALALAAGLLVVGGIVFTLTPQRDGSVAALVYLPLPFLLWAAVRFGPVGAATALVAVTFLAVFATVNFRGPFAASTPDGNMLPLQLFLITLSLPLMSLATLGTERRVRENALRESEARFRAMADEAPVLIGMFDTNGGGTFFNRPWLEFTGRTLDKAAGDGWLDDVHADDQALARGHLGAHSPAPSPLEFRLRRHDGEYHWIAIRHAPRRAPDSTLLGYIGCGDDVTPRRTAEIDAARHRGELAHVARLSTLGELGASFAHEVNQPLAAILANAEAALLMLSRDGVDRPELMDICRDIVSANQRASDVVRHIRALSRKEKVDVEALDIESVIGGIVRLLHANALLRQSHVTLDVAAGLPPVAGHRIELQQVVLNLLLNAFDAVDPFPAERREIVVRARLASQGAVVVAVSDRGTGIGSADLERIFAPFHTTKATGLGIGLSISRTIVCAHGGRLWAENNPGGGATFRFTLPIAARAAGTD